MTFSLDHKFLDTLVMFYEKSQMESTHTDTQRGSTPGEPPIFRDISLLFWSRGVHFSPKPQPKCKINESVCRAWLLQLYYNKFTF